jgi:hypothetical protein
LDGYAKGPPVVSSPLFPRLAYQLKNRSRCLDAFILLDDLAERSSILDESTTQLQAGQPTIQFSP